jgi:hypothetical protein
MPFPTIHVGQRIFNYRVVTLGARDSNGRYCEVECLDCGEHSIKLDCNLRKCKTPCNHPAQRPQSKEQERIERAAEAAYFHNIRYSLCFCGKPRLLDGTQYHNFCSRECRNVYGKAGARRRLGIANPEARECRSCGLEFTPVNATQKNWCDNCRKNQRYYNVWHETVIWRRVFDRDGWSCQHCKTETPEFLRNTHLPESPELDHVLPIACGGAHSYANTQCLCRACNAKKKDNPSREPRLIGVTDLTPFKVAKYPPTAKSGRPKKPACAWMDLTGRVFGLLTVEKYLGNQKKGYLCRCRCGRTRILHQGELTGGAGRRRMVRGKCLGYRGILLCCYGGDPECRRLYNALRRGGVTGNKRVDALAAA